MLGCQRKNCWLGGLKILSVGLLVVGDNGPELFIYELVITRLWLTGFDSLEDPLLELKFLSIRTAVQPELKVLFALPEFLGSQPESLPILRANVWLILVIIARDVWGKASRVSVLIEQEFRKVAVFEGEFEAGGFFVVVGEEAHAKGVNDPFGLKLEFGGNGWAMSPKLEEHFFGVIHPPSCVVGCT